MSDDGNLAVGFGTAAIAVVFFGSSYVPAKKYYMGDGMFFQWTLCLGIWFVGVLVNIVVGAPKFELFAMLGGAFWCTGNLFVIPIIQCVGMAMGLLLWGATNMIVGWSMGYFGWFGLNRAPEAAVPALNFVGVAIALCALGSMAFVKTSVADGEDQIKDIPDDDHISAASGPGSYEKLTDKVSDQRTSTSSRIEDPLIKKGANGEGIVGPNGEMIVDGDQLLPPCPLFTDNFTPIQKTIFGYSAAAAIGILYAVNFVPPQFLLDNKRGSQNILDYVFSHFTGLFFASTIYFLIYCVIKKNKPWINPKSAFPGFLSGIMWAIAQTSWFVANNELNYTIAYPIVTTGPGVIGALWGVFVFQEIKGKKNFIVLCGAIALTILGVGLIAGSRVG